MAFMIHFSQIQNQETQAPTQMTILWNIIVVWVSTVCSFVFTNQNSESEQFFSLPTFSATQTFPMTNVVDQRAMMNNEEPNNGTTTQQQDVSTFLM